MNVMIVEDESIVAMEIADYVRSIGYEVVATASTAQKAYEAATKHRPFAILMDINLKGDEDGIGAAIRIKKEHSCAIIYLTAYSDDVNIERAVRTEPSGYLLKPFNRSELLAALKIAQSRLGDALHVKRGDTVLDDEFSFDNYKGELLCRGEYVHLTRRESELLKLLLNNRNTTLDLYTIENSIWPEKTPNENTRRALISRLRAKLNQRFIETVAGVGYRMNF